MTAESSGLALLFFLLLVGGEVILLPVLHFNLGDKAFLTIVVVLAILASVVSDLVWYSVGRYASRIPLVTENARLRRAKARMGLGPQVLATHWKQLLLLSKFVYGTRTSAQVICGATRRPLAPYLAVDVVGTTLLVLYLTCLTSLFARGFSSLGHWTGMVTSVLATMACSFLVGKAVWRVHHRRSRL